MLRPFDFLKRINCHKVSSHVCTVDSKLTLSAPLIPFDIQLNEFASKLRSYKLQALGQAILHSAISVRSPHGGGDLGARQNNSVKITERGKVVEKSEPVQKSDIAPRSLANTVSKRSAPGLKRGQGPAEVSSSRHAGASELPEYSEKTEADFSAKQHVLERNAEGNEGHDDEADEEFAGYDGGDGDEQGVGDGEEGGGDEDGGDNDDGGDDEEDGDSRRALGDDDDDEGTGGGGAVDEESYEGGSEGEQDEANEHGVSVNESRKSVGSQRLRSGDEADLWFDRKMRHIDARICNEALEPKDRFDIMDSEEDTDDDDIDLPQPDARNHAVDENMRIGSLSGGDPMVVEVGRPKIARCKTAQLTETQTSSPGDGTEANTSKWKDKRGTPGFPTMMRQMFTRVMEMPTEKQTRSHHDDAVPGEDDMDLENEPLFRIPDDEDKDLTPGDEIESHMKESKGGPHFLDTKFTETEVEKAAGPACGGEGAENTKEQGEKEATTNEDAGDAGDGGAQRVPSGLGDPLSAGDRGMSSHGGRSGGDHDAEGALVFGETSPPDTTEPLTDNRDEGDKLLHMVCTRSGSQIAPDSMEREDGGGIEGVCMATSREVGDDDEEADADANLEQNMDVDKEDGLGKEASCRGRSRWRQRACDRLDRAIM
ncbi:hypothetical protein CBR_g37171 [Chara braunii]|uniref:Uncharacterized protein n=1 Tax=Chara braunii TaxID=69332 RepID=A0A388LMA8_CHABU|nr:hypothetical protein CBR_g37171 [Chara braunii]|eukprot:GBG83459.1 hypothetical protein CBR_g37171 [Chara braunii]